MYSTEDALKKFAEVRQKAFFQDVIALLTRHSNDLLAFDQVRESLHARQQVDRGTRMIELDKIVGSVGRYRDFTRQFMPRPHVQRERWGRLDRALNAMETIPPIEVYQIGDVYFVKDGNHRVSVARANGLKDIEAHVIEVPSRIPLTPDVTPDELIVKAEYVEFLEQTRLDVLRSDSKIELTIPGGYARLLEHIEVHRYYLGLKRQDEVSYQDAITSWYGNVYHPVVQAIREFGVLRDFPGRTEGDLYIWISDHLHYLREQFGPAVDAEIAATDFAEHYSHQPVKRVVHAVKRVAKEIVDPGDVPEVVEHLLKRVEEQEQGADGSQPPDGQPTS
jgi:hypothetical protein